MGSSLTSRPASGDDAARGWQRRRHGHSDRSTSAVDARLGAGLLLLALPAVLTLYSMLLPVDSYTAASLPERLSGPDWRHPLGTDELGRDVLRRISVGARVSLVLSVSVVLIAGLAGLLVGSTAGYGGGAVDHTAVFLVDTFLSFPPMLLALALVAVLGTGLTQLFVGLAISTWPGYARIARSLVVALRGRGFVEALRALGASNTRIIFRHLLPHIAGPMLVQAMLDVPAVLLMEGGMSFLGLGVQPPDPSWGAMIDEGRRHLVDDPALVVVPGAAVLLTVLGLNLLGEALAARMDPRRA
ncbi:MAG: ABC transporter permease [Acidobacteriota bacterium]